MQIDDILLLRMNRQYLFAPAEDELTVLRDLCGLQAQFYGNCLHALRLRCGKAPDEDILRTSAVKTWTLRGTLHLIALDDLPLFLYDGRSHFLRPCDTMENDDHLSAARKRELAAIILDAAQSGCGGREELRLLCRGHGMTLMKNKTRLIPGAGCSARCAKAARSATPRSRKRLRPAPPFAPMTKADALRALMRRYLTHYGPVTVQDAAYFFGLPQRELLPVIESLSPREFVYEGKYFTAYAISILPAIYPVVVFLRALTRSCSDMRSGQTRSCPKRLCAACSRLPVSFGPVFFLTGRSSAFGSAAGKLLN